MFNILCGAPTCNIGVESVKLTANTKRSSNAGYMLYQRLRRLPNIKPSLGDAPGHILLSAMYPGFTCTCSHLGAIFNFSFELSQTCS